MDWLPHLLHADHQTLTLLIVLCLVATPVLLLLLVGYLFWVRRASRPARDIADQAHQEVLSLLQGHSDFAAMQTTLLEIEHTLAALAETLRDVQRKMEDRENG